MATINLTPLLASVAGTEAATTAKFTATAMRAGRPAVRTSAAAVTFSVPYTARWDGNQWDRPPTLDILPVGEYWNVRVDVPGATPLVSNVILPSGADIVDYGDLIAVTPDSGTADQTAVAQVTALQQFTTNVLNDVRSIAAEVADAERRLNGQENA